MLLLTDLIREGVFTMATTTITATTIVRIIPLGSHNIEILANGSVDIVDNATLGEKEYTHLSSEEARQLFPSLVA
jgi:hypothetical protein